MFYYNKVTVSTPLTQNSFNSEELKEARIKGGGQPVCRLFTDSTLSVST